MSDESTCAYCDELATETCRFCGRDYCALHGGDLCIACTAARSSAPSATIFHTLIAAFGVCVLIGIWLLVASPRLPGEVAPETERAQSSGSTAHASPSSSPRPGGSPTATGTPVNTRLYAVQPGDTVASIAQAIGVAPASIVTLNPNLDPNNLQIGQSLRVPVSQAP